MGPVCILRAHSKAHKKHKENIEDSVCYSYNVTALLGRGVIENIMKVNCERQRGVLGEEGKQCALQVRGTAGPRHACIHLMNIY